MTVADDRPPGPAPADEPPVFRNAREFGGDRKAFYVSGAVMATVSIFVPETDVGVPGWVLGIPTALVMFAIGRRAGQRGVRLHEDRLEVVNFLRTWVLEWGDIVMFEVGPFFGTRSTIVAHLRDGRMLHLGALASRKPKWSSGEAPQARWLPVLEEHRQRAVAAGPPGTT